MTITIILHILLHPTVFKRYSTSIDKLYLLFDLMINKLIIYNQNIQNLKDDLKINFQNKIVTVRFCKNSILRLKPHLYTAVIDEMIHFDEERIEEETVLRTGEVKLDLFKNSLAMFLKTYFQEKKHNVKCKMDLVKLYASLNDLKNTMKVLKQMNRSSNVKMIEFILKMQSLEDDWKLTNGDELFYSDSAISNKNPSTSYESFLEICEGLDFHSRYLFAIEMVPVFPSNILFQLYNDINHTDMKNESIRCMEKDTVEIKLNHSADETLKYELSVFIRVKIAHEFIKRRQFRMAAVTLMRLAMEMCDIENIGLRLEMMRIGYSLLNRSHVDKKYSDDTIKYNVTAEDASKLNTHKKHNIAAKDSSKLNVRKKHNVTIEESSKLNTLKDNMKLDDVIDLLNFQLMLSPIELFYIKSDHSKNIRIQVSSCTEIFTFDVVRTKLENVFTDQFIIKTTTMDEVMGVVGIDGTFYPADSGKIRSEKTVECARVILKDGRQIESYFKMEKIERDSSIDLIKVDERDSLIRLEFRYTGRLNCYFMNAVEQNVEQDRLVVVFNRKSKTTHENRIECNIEIKPGIYELIYIPGILL